MASSGNEQKGLKVFMLHMHRGDPKSLVNFRRAELDSLGVLAGVEAPFYDEADVKEEDTFWFVRLPSAELAKKLVSRAVTIKAVYECWGRGPTLEDTIVAVKNYPQQAKDPYLAIDQSFAIKVTGFGVTVSIPEQKELRESFNFLKLLGPIDLKNPMNEFVVMVDAGHQPAAQHNGQKVKQYLFCRLISEVDKTALNAMTLKKRSYLGPTSTCHELAALMATQGLARPNATVYDPFVGTGSLLVMAAHFGAFTFGSDFDWLLLHGKTRGATSHIRDNFKQYKLRQPELMVADSSIPGWRAGVQFDAIICDPPYGVRAGARKSLAREVEIPKELMTSHIPPSQPYEVEDVMLDLLDNSARWLKLGGRLVYLLPTTPDFTNEELPRHPCLELLAVSEQLLRPGFSRRLVTMAKTKEWIEGMSVQRRNKDSEPAPSFALLRDKLLSQDADAKYGDVTELSRTQAKKKERVIKKRAAREAAILRRKSEEGKEGEGAGEGEQGPKRGRRRQGKGQGQGKGKGKANGKRGAQNDAEVSEQQQQSKQPRQESSSSLAPSSSSSSSSSSSLSSTMEDSPVPMQE